MRLIDADALKEHIQANAKIYAEAQFPIDVIIDNAPTVNPSLNLDNITEEDIEKFKMIWQRMTSKGLLVINEDRPKGKWIIIADVYCKCPFCSNVEVKFSNYCPECGVRLEGGAE